MCDELDRPVYPDAPARSMDVQEEPKAQHCQPDATVIVKTGHVPSKVISISSKGVSCSTAMVTSPRIVSNVVYELTKPSVWPRRSIPILGRDRFVSDSSVLALRAINDDASAMVISNR